MVLRKTIYALIISFCISLCSSYPTVKAHASAQKEPVTSIEAYSGENVVTINDNVPSFSADEIVSKSFEGYGKRDKLGRCTACIACIGNDLMPTTERTSIGMVKPTGWNQNKYPGLIDTDPPYLYNRCHLIAFQLTGDNLITGTRYMNTEGMLPYENMVADYVRGSTNHVMYRVTPIFTEDNLLCDGVQIEAYSVEDKGKSVSFNVFCYNIQPGVTIDYSDGSNKLDETYAPESAPSEETPRIIPAPEEPASDSQAQAYTYVGNRNTKKFHRAGCSSISDMTEKNKEYFYGDRSEPASKYVPCKRCNP